MKINLRLIVIAWTFAQLAQHRVEIAPLVFAGAKCCGCGEKMRCFFVAAKDQRIDTKVGTKLKFLMIMKSCNTCVLL